MVQCPKCMEDVEEGRKCPSCGFDPADSNVPLQKDEPCPLCDHPFDGVKCKECGYDPNEVRQGRKRREVHFDK